MASTDNIYLNKGYLYENYCKAITLQLDEANSIILPEYALTPIDNTIRLYFNYTNDYSRAYIDLSGPSFNFYNKTKDEFLTKSISLSYTTTITDSNDPIRIFFMTSPYRVSYTLHSETQIIHPIGYLFIMCGFGGILTVSLRCMLLAMVNSSGIFDSKANFKINGVMELAAMMRPHIY